MATEGYVYDTGWREERDRLAGIEALWDAGSQRAVEALGISPAWRCWEVGAGGGSFTAWLAGRAGRVLATDLDPRFVEPLTSDVVEVRRHDAVADPLPDERFDLVHARLLLEHLPAREAVMDRLVEALAPGGWLVLEDYDWTPFGFDPEDDDLRAGAEGVLAFMALAGFERDFGRRLASALSSRGLEDVRAEGRQLAIGRDHPGHPFFALSAEQLTPGALQAQTMTPEVAERLRASLTEPGRWLLTPTLVTAAGRAQSRES